MSTASSVATIYGRSCTICRHSELFDIDAALVEHRPITQISQQFNVSRDSLYRHQSFHLAPALKERLVQRAEFSAASMASRVVDIANDARQARVAAFATGNRRDGARLSEVELKALSVLVDKLRIDHDDVAHEVTQAGHMATAVGEFIRRRPELGEELAAIFTEAGQEDLALAVRQEAHRGRTENHETREVAP